MDRPNDPRLRTLADLVAAIRPAWHVSRIDNTVHALVPKHGYRQVALACIHAALDERTSSPAGIAFHVDRLATPTPATPADRHPCDKCGRVHLPFQTHCQTYDVEVTTRGAARAREALVDVKPPAEVNSE